MTVGTRPHRLTHLLAVAGVTVGFALPAALAAALPVWAADVPPAVSFHSSGNPILGDGSYYTADAAPLVVGDKLYIYAGHDESAPQDAGFNMRDYGVYSTSDVAGGDWSLVKGDLVPGQVFSWATGNNAYAGQAVAGPDGKYYWYVPVQSKDTSAPNAMAIGVAVSDTPVGPWKDAIGAPLVKWSDVFGTSTQGQEIIDPAIFKDDDGTVYLYWGSWGTSRAVKLTASMTQTTGAITTLSGLDSFYEAPWVFKRNGIYYMAYDWKQGGSSCTPSNYQACIGYATASNPLGPWTYRGIILGGTSATTVHPSIVQFKDKWYITYHTKDAAGGGHFRRSVAIDEVKWDGDTILPVTQTLADDPKYRLTRNVAPSARPSASFTEQPPMRLGALNDGRALTALLPPDQWGNFRGTDNTVESDWVSYQWDAPVRVDSTGIQFQEDPNWIRPPASWGIEYVDANGDWKPVTGANYPAAVAGQWQNVSFDPVTTTALRATFKGQPEGAKYHSVSVSEWEVYAASPAAPAAVTVSTKPGVAPALPEAVRLPYGAAGDVWAPVNWRPVGAAAYAQAGSFTVEGRVLGYADRMLTAQVTVDPNASTPAPTDTTAPTTTISLSGTSGQDGWFSSPVTARVTGNDDIDYRTTVATRVGDGQWTSAPNSRYVDVPVTAQGTTSVSGRATDAAGNASAVVTRSIKIDTEAPQADASVDPQSRATTITGSDSRSGLDVIQYRLDDATSWQTYAGSPVAAPDGRPHTLIYRVLDKAGNATSGTATVPPAAGTQLTGNIAGYATASASFTSGWEQVKGLNDGTAGVLETAENKLGTRWGTYPEVGEQWARLDWPFAASIDRVGVWWFQDAADADNAGMIAPRTWKLQYLDADGTTWKDITPTGGTGYGRTRDAFVPVSFDKVTTRSLRISAQAWGAASGQGSIGVREWQVIAASGSTGTDNAAPTVTLAADPAQPSGANGWYTGPVSVTPQATDDTDPAPKVEAAVDGGTWAVVSGPVTFGSDGAHVVKFRATDATGNVSTEATWSGKVDATAPVSKAVWSSSARTVTLAAADDTSSVGAVEYSVGNGAWQAYATPIAVGSDATTVRYRATDGAGNVEATRTVVVPKAGVKLATSRLSAVLSASTVRPGDPATVTVAVTGSGIYKATGTVRVTDGNVEIATGRLAAGRVTLDVPATLMPGLHRLAVQYSGDDSYAASSASVNLRVLKGTSTTTVQTAATAAFGHDQSIAVAVAGSGGVQATGRVTVKVDGRSVATGLLSGGAVDLALPGLSTGRHQVTVAYGGDGNLGGSASEASVEVTKAPSTATVSLDPAQPSSAVRGKAVVQVTADPSTVVPTGSVTVTLTADGVNTVVAGRLVGGKAVITLPRLKAGSYQLAVAYAGTANISSSSVSIPVTVSAG